MKEVTYLLVPGLNDTKPLFKWFYAWIGRRWSRRGMSTVVCCMDWEGSEPYEEKLQRIEHRVEKLRAEGRAVVLVGVSAGASLVALVYSRHPGSIAALVTVCGFMRLAPGDELKLELFNHSWYRAGQASQTAIDTLSGVQRERILCLIPERDTMVAPKRAQIAGAAVVQLRGSGHLWAIVVSMVWYWRTIKRFVSSLH